MDRLYFLVALVVMLGVVGCSWGGPSERSTRPRAGNVPAGSYQPSNTDSTTANWVKPGVEGDQLRADLDACYGYALAQIDHDRAIDADRSAATYDINAGLGYRTLESGQKRFSERRRRSANFERCMVEKGYTRQ